MDCKGHQDIDYIKETVQKFDTKLDNLLEKSSKNEVRTKINRTNILALWGVLLSSGAYLIKFLLGVKS